MAHQWCGVCGVRDDLNPIEDHETWLGHPWTPRDQPGRDPLVVSGPDSPADAFYID